MTEISIARLMAYHRKRRVTLRGTDNQIINWPRCLAIWDKLGRPIVYAGSGDPFFDLSLYFFPEKLSLRKLQNIANWLKEHSGERVQKPLQDKPTPVSIPWSDSLIIYEQERHGAYAFYEMENSPISLEPSPKKSKKRRKPLTQSVLKPEEMLDPRFQEFNLRFLLAAQVFSPRMAIDLVRSCHEDIELFGFEYARKKWSKFVGIVKV